MIVHSKFDGLVAITVAVVTGSGRGTGSSPSRPWSSSLRSRSTSPPATTLFSAAISARWRSFSASKEGRCAKPEKKLPMGRVTLVIARCSGAIGRLRRVAEGRERATFALAVVERDDRERDGDEHDHQESRRARALPRDHPALPPRG